MPAKQPGVSRGFSVCVRHAVNRSGTNMALNDTADHTVQQRYRVLIHANIGLVAMVESAKEIVHQGLFG